MKRFIYLLFVLSLALPGHAQTTLANETANNTSAASAFTGWTNGVPAPHNTSKVPISLLLPQGTSAKFYAEYQSWWGKPGQPSIGYSSKDPRQQEATVQDMISRGISGLIDDWYGQNGWDDQVMLGFKATIEKHPGFEFAIMEDQGAIKWNPCSGCTPTQSVIYHLNYIAKTYFVSPNYMRFNGRPVIFLFGTEIYSIDWVKVKASVQGNPLLLQRNGNAITNLTYDGAYAWIQPVTTNFGTYEGLDYLDGFYSSTAFHLSRIALGSAFKGFDDTVAPWAPPGGRHVAQLCGKTWLDSLSAAAGYVQSATPVKAIQLVTWNDYQEGTEIETGIDNCVSIQAASSVNMLSWSITGDEATLDHYTVFQAAGSALTKLADVPTGTHEYSLSSLGLKPGTFQFFVEAVGKPSLFNHMSTAISMTIPPDPPTVSIIVGTQDPGKSPVRVMVKATAGTFPLSSTQLYMDGVLVYTAPIPGQIDRWICLAPGVHNLTVNQLDTVGTVAKATTSVVVQ